MPSGAKKRKAAKKKAQKQAHNTDGSHLQGVDETKSHDGRESDGGEGERGSSEERLNKNEEGEQNVAEFSKEARLKESYDDDGVKVNVDDDVRRTKNGKHKSSSSSSGSSSSEDDEVAVEKEKPVGSEFQSSLPEASRENPVISEAVYRSVEESFPVEESVKQVVSLPQEVKTGSESVAVENPVITHVIESGEKDKVSSGMTEFLEEKIEKKTYQVQEEEGPKNQSESADITVRNGEGLPQSSGVTSADACFEGNHVKESETQKYVEDQPLAPSAQLAVRRTSLMNCCGLLEVFSGGASR